jgi:hypothetical protein
MPTPGRFRALTLLLAATTALAPVSALVVPAFAEDPEPAPAPVPEWKQTFERAYRLADGQVLKRVPPPHIPERLTYYRTEHQGQAQAIAEPPDSFLFFVEPDGTFHNWGMSFHGGKVPLKHVLTFPLQMESYEFEGPENLLSIDLIGDWVVRPRATREQKLAALARVMKESTGRLVTFEKREVERDVVVAKGQFKLAPLPGQGRGNQVYLYVDPFKPNDGGGGGAGDLPRFLDTLGTRVRLRVVDETDGPPPAKFGWEHQRSSYLSREPAGPERDRKLRALLDNVFKQTGLKFETARRKVPVWFLTEGPAAG